MYGNNKPTPKKRMTPVNSKGGTNKKRMMPVNPKGGMNRNFKTCPTCPNPAKCRAMGKCMKKMGRK